MVTFDAGAPGTPVDAWDRAFDDAPDLVLAGSGPQHAIVVAAHPDDETLGAGGLIARLAERGDRVTVVVVTDGGASHAVSGPDRRAELVRVRSAELHAAVAALAPDAAVREFGLPDGATREHRGLVAELLRTELAEATMVVAPWSGDGHRDHRVVGEVCEVLAEQLGLRLIAYPIWFWHWGDPTAELGPFERLEVLAVPERHRRRKDAAIGEYRSQTGAAEGAPPVLHPGFLRHFGRDREAFVVALGSDARARHFDRLHRADDDPWHVADSWYERRKRAVLLALPQDERLGAVLELGASAGHLTERLAERADSVTAVDLSPAAVDLARARVGAAAHVHVVVGDLREGVPAGPFDLVVLSEVGYYLDPGELARTLDGIAAALAPGGALLACHWLGESDDFAQNGRAVHAAIDARFTRRVLHEDEAFVATVYGCRL